MANVSLTLEGKLIGTIITGFEISEQDAGRIFTWASDNFAQDESTPVSIMETVARNALNTILSQVLAYEKDQAAKRAMSEVQNIKVL